MQNRFQQRASTQDGVLFPNEKKKRELAPVRIGKLLEDRKSPEDALKQVKDTGLSLKILKHAGLVKDRNDGH